MIDKNIDEQISEDDLDSEIVELEFDENSVVYYIVDKNDNEIGVCLKEDGNEVEYLYEEGPSNDELQKMLAKEQVAFVSSEIKDIRNDLMDFKEDAVNIGESLLDTTKEIKSAIEDVKDSFKIFPKKKK